MFLGLFGYFFFSFLYQGLGSNLSFRFLSVLPAGTTRFTIRQVFFFFIFCCLSLGLVVWPRLGDQFVTHNPWFWAVHIAIIRIVKFKLLAPSRLITFLTQWCLVLNSFCANSQHSLTVWLIVSSLLPHNIHLLFFCHLSILALKLLVLMTLFCAAIKKDSVSFIKFPFLSHVQFFSCKIVSRLKYPYNSFSSHFCFLVIYY